MAYSDGLCGLWYLEEAAGASRLDSSGNGNTLSESGGNVPQETTTVKQGSASAGAFASTYLVREDGDLSAGFPCKNGVAATSWTLGAWIYTTDDAATDCAITKGTSTSRFNLYTVGQGSSAIKVYGLYNSSTAIISENVATSTWHLVILRFDNAASEFNVAVNDTWDTAQPEKNYATTEDSFDIGSFAGAVWWNSGYIDEVFMYNRALTDAECTAINTNTLSVLLAAEETAPSQGGAWASGLLATPRYMKRGTPHPVYRRLKI